MSEAESRIAPFGADREVSRQNFLKTAAWAGAALSAAGITGFGVAVREAHAVHEGYLALGGPGYDAAGDVAIFQFAYQLELLEGTFYDMGVNAGITTGAALDQIAAIRDHEMAHAETIATTLQDLGAAVPATPQFTYPPGTFSDYAAFLELANTFEPVGIGAFSGAAPAIQNKELLSAAGSILGVECEHWNAIKILRGVQPPNNVAFEEALPLPAVQEAVAPFGITG